MTEDQKSIAERAEYHKGNLEDLTKNEIVHFLPAVLANKDAVIAELRAALAKSQPVEQGKSVRPMSETTAWLIELNIANAPCWLTGTGAYTNDANEALQFVREIDAKAMLDVYMGAKFGKEIISIYKRHFAPENYRVTEHIFHGIKGATE